jgi:D-3-phosphoglycerate dehydrogenase / 2-oxoglutarate reductase
MRPGGHPSAPERILITDSDLGPPTIEEEILRRSGFSLVERQCTSEEDVIGAISEIRPVGLLVQYAPVTSAVVQNAPGLRVVVRYGVGLDTIDVDAAAALGVEVRSVPDYATGEVADHTVALSLMLLRRLRGWTEATRLGQWPTAGTAHEPMPPLQSLRVGLLGFGRIAQAVALRMRAFGCHVASHDPFVPPRTLREMEVRPVTWEELWAGSLLVSLHAPLSPATEGCVDGASLSAMRPGSLLVNTARAGLVDRKALEFALEAGAIGGFAVDGWWDEPPRPGDQLLTDDRVVVTPHVAYLSATSLERLRRTAAEAVVDGLTESIYAR